ncbi:MAG: hypothetical protein V3U60_11015 [Gammaproteobacteria bacterium]
MPRFDSPGAAFSRGFARTTTALAAGRDARTREKALRQAQEEKRIERIVSGFQQSQLASEQNAQQFVDIALKMIEAGQGEGQEFDQVLNGAQAAVMGHGQVLEEIREQASASGLSQDIIANMPSGSDFVSSRLEMFNAQISGAKATAESSQIKTISGAALNEIAPELPEGAVVQRDASGKITMLFDPSDNPSTKQEQFGFLQQAGFTDEQAALVTGGGVAIGFDPLTRSFGLFNKATGEPIGGATEQPAADGETLSMFPGGIVTPEALGTFGVLKNVTNVLRDTIGLGLGFPEAQEATNALESLNLYTITTMQTDVPGRPSQFLLERIEKLTVKPNNFFQGEERAKSKLTQTKRLIDGEIARIENEVLTQQLDPKVRSETNINLTQTKRLSEAYGDLIAGFDKPTDAPAGVSAADAAIWNELSDEAKALILKQVDSKKKQ